MKMIRRQKRADRICWMLVISYLVGGTGGFLFSGPLGYFTTIGGFMAVLVLLFLLVNEQSRQRGRQLQWYDSGYGEE
jgi:asparagine N-glycosylation enzyme membrane subunit Stt3